MATVDPVRIPSGSMSQVEGEKLFKSLKANSVTEGPTPGWSAEVMAAFSVAPAVFSNEAGGSMSVFSSLGLDNELHIKPVSPLHLLRSKTQRELFFHAS